MATISTEKMFLKTGQEFKKVITYSRGLFRIKLPDQLCKDMNLENLDKELRANSEYEVDILFRAKLKEWNDAIEKVSRVILFDSKFQGALLKEEKWQEWDGGSYKPYHKTNRNNSMDQGCWYFCHEDIGRNNDLALSIIWGVYDKKDVHGKISYHFVSGRDLDLRWGLKGDYTEIEHTEEREKFFLELDESFARMIAKVYKALGELTPEKLMMLSDSGIKLLS